MKKNIYKIYLGLLILIPIILILLPPSFFDNGDSICISVLFFDKECYGCGMTRAIQHLIHLDFTNAKECNKLSFIVLPLLIMLLIKEVKRIVSELKK